jgi:hypothetical protein
MPDMPRSISLLLSRTGGPPYQGSVGFVNDAILPILQRHGWHANLFRPPAREGAEEAMLPFALAASHARHDGRGIVDVALHDAAGTAIRTPGRHWARRHAVLYHGLAYGTGAWMTNPDIDLHCANSPYLARVLRALLAFPDWSRRRCLNSRVFGAVTDIRLPVPCIAEPDGDAGFAYGADLPPPLLGLFDSDLILGHALQPGKQDWIATLSILYVLNGLARSHRTPRIKLLVSEASLGPDNRRMLDALLAQSGSRCDDFFVPVPHLKQRALFRLMRACRFGLSYNKFPEPFGFYVLESVHNGCPVYTNGAGNNRFLLPPEHGITVLETAAMSGTASGPPGPDAYRVVAETIHSDLIRADEVRARCRRGALLIDRTWSLAAFEQSLVSALESLEQSPVPEPEFDALEIALSPLVRSLDLESGRSLNDYASGQLEPASVAAVRRLLGQRCADVDGAEMERLEALHGLFGRGILTLLP